MKLSRFLFAFAVVALIAGQVEAQTAPVYMLPTTFSAAGSYPTNGISVGPPNNTSVIELQATGSGSGLSFSIQGTPVGSTTPVALKMYTAPSCAATVSSGTASGDWFIPVAGFTNIKLVIATITGSETFGITASTQANCASLAGVSVTTTPSGGGAPTIPSKLNAYGTLTVTSSVPLHTLTVGPNSAAWSTTLPSGYLYIYNQQASAGSIYICWFGGTCSASVGEELVPGAAKTRSPVGSTVDPTLFSTVGATINGEE